MIGRLPCHSHTYTRYPSWKYKMKIQAGPVANLDIAYMFHISTLKAHYFLSSLSYYVASSFHVTLLSCVGWPFYFLNRRNREKIVVPVVTSGCPTAILLSHSTLKHQRENLPFVPAYFAKRY